jgi:hypothetical protein
MRVLVGVLAVIGVNILVVLIAVPIGLAIDELFWSIAAAELALLLACLVAAVVVRARRGLGPGLVLGWAIGYLGLVGTVVALAVAAFVVFALLWLALSFFSWILYLIY